MTVEGGVAVVTLASPSNRNALSTALLASLHRALDTVEAESARVIVLTHVPPAFCAGADLKERASGPVDSRPMTEAMERLMSTPRPVIAAVTGPVRAGGVGLMAACDLIVVSASVDFAFTEVRLGLTPAIISVPILRRVQPSALAAPYLTGERFGALTARDMGLVTHVGADQAEVWSIVSSLVDGILASEPVAVAATKSLLWTLRDLPAGERMDNACGLSDRFFQSAHGAEGMAAFAEKRQPSWDATGSWKPPIPPASPG